MRDVAADWNATGDVPEIAELLASELVTNAIAYGSPDIADVTPIRVTVTGEKRLLTVDVHDSCSEIPCLGQADERETNGRDLTIVQNLSCNWGWTLNPYGKSAWFQLMAWRWSAFFRHLDRAG